MALLDAWLLDPAPGLQLQSHVNKLDADSHPRALPRLTKDTKFAQIHTYMHTLIEYDNATVNPSTVLANLECSVTWSTIPSKTAVTDDRPVQHWNMTLCKVEFRRLFPPTSFFSALASSACSIRRTLRTLQVACWGTGVGNPVHT